MSELIVIGSGTGIPSLRRGSPGTVILTDHSTLLIDSGPGTLRRMLEVGITYRDVDLLLYTHIHPDHISDFVPILFACKYADLPREKDLVCVGGPGFKNHVDQLKAIYGSWIDPQTYHLTIKEASQKPLDIHGLKIFSKPIAHTHSSVAYRIGFKDGTSVVLSGDTDYCSNIIDLASGTDLLVLECSFPEGQKIEGHLTPVLAGRIAKESGCKRLLLTHFYPACDTVDILKECRQVYQGEIVLGEDLLRIEL